MKTLTTSSVRTLVVLFVILVIAAFVTYELASPTGYYAREKADLRSSALSDESAYSAMDGTPIDPTSFQGTPIVINVWATWSPFSAQELPILAKLQREFGDRVTIIAMNRNETAATVEAYRATIDDTTGLLFVQDGSDFFFESVEGYAMPETIFYDATGNIVDRFRGTLSEQQFKAYIEQTIAGGKNE